MKVETLLRKRLDHLRNERRSRLELEALRLAKFRHLAVLEFLSTSRDPRELYLGRYHVVHTSRSSGEVGQVYSPEEWTCGIAHGLRTNRVLRVDAKTGKFRLVCCGLGGGLPAGNDADLLVLLRTCLG